MFGLDGLTTFELSVAFAFQVATLVLAVLLLAAGFNRTPNRALALALLASVWSGVSGLLAFIPATDRGGNYAFSRHGFFLDSLALLPFLANYPAPRRRLPAWARRLWPYLGLALLFEVLQTFWPESGFNPRGANGPLQVADFLVDGIGSLFVPLVLVLEVRRGRYEDVRGPLFLAGYLPGGFIGGDLAGVLGMLGAPVAPAFDLVLPPPTATQGIIDILVPARLALGLALLGALGYTAAAMRKARWPGLVAGTVLGATCAWTLAYAFHPGVVAQRLEPLSWFLSGLPISLAALALIFYVALKDQTVGLNRKVRIGISRAALALIFLGVFFVVAQVAQNWLSDQAGTVVGGVAAGLLLFAIAPLQRVAERVARVDKAKPDDRTAQVYREAVELTLADKTISPREERHLAHLAERLGLAAGQAMDIRLDVQEALGKDRGSKGRHR